MRYLFLLLLTGCTMTPLQEAFVQRGHGTRETITAQEIRAISPIIEVEDGTYKIPHLGDMPLGDSCSTLRTQRMGHEDLRCADEILAEMEGYAFGLAYNRPDKYVKFAFITDSRQIMIFDPLSCNWDRHALTNIYINK